MSLIKRLRCWIGGCQQDVVHHSDALKLMKKNIDETAALKRTIRERRSLADALWDTRDARRDRHHD